MPEIVERGPRVRALGVEPRQLRHDDERHLPLERQRLEALQHEGQIFVLRRAGHAARRRDELEVVDYHQPERSEEHTSELQSQSNLVCRLLLEKKKKATTHAMQNRTSAAMQHT